MSRSRRATDIPTCEPFFYGLTSALFPSDGPVIGKADLGPPILHTRARPVLASTYCVC